ncbi:MAG: UvrD-helicase domain-containing protein, partial [Deltaproteobacteria bacterium]|nr:UvrD-helicase domain-containing protein [Deltaproteobacteria bacterium]
MSGSDRFLLAHDRVVQAGAGTGKTHALLTQYLHLVAGVTAYRRAIPPSQICALTFTEKAAAEMRERLTSRVTKICRRLAEENPESPAAALRDSEPALVESAERLGVKLPDASAWEQVLASLGGATISTFHSFAASLLRRYSQQVGLDPEFSLLDEDGAAQRLRDTCEELVLSALEQPASVVDGPEFGETMEALLTELGFASSGGGDGGLVEVLCLLHRQRAEEGRPIEGIAAAYRPERLAVELTQARDRLSTVLHQLASRADELADKSSERAMILGGLAVRVVNQLHSLDDLAGCRPVFEQIRDCLKLLRAP